MSSFEDGARSQIVHINSRNRVDGSIGDFHVVFADGLIAVNRHGGAIRVEPIQACVPRYWQTLDANNNSFALTNETTAQSVTVSVPIGYFDAINLARILCYVLTTALTTLNGSAYLGFFCVGYAQYNSALIFVPPADGYVYSLGVSNLFALPLGFSDPSVSGAPTPSVQSAAFSWTAPLFSPNPVKLTLESTLLVHANFCCVSMSRVDNLLSPAFAESDVLLKIPITGQIYDNLVWRSNGRDITAFDLCCPRVTSMRLYLTDEFGRNLQPTCDYTLSLRFTYYEMVHPADTTVDLLNSMNTCLMYIANVEMHREAKTTRAQEEAKIALETSVEMAGGDADDEEGGALAF